jgi:hypothetical protein
MDPRGELGDTKASIGRVVNKKGLVAHFSGVGQENLSNSVGHAVDQQFAPLDIRMGG